MDSLIAQVLAILTEPSGDLIYHLVQVFSALATLMLAIVSRRSREDKVYKRFMLGIIVVMISQLFLFLVSTFGWRGLFDTHLILPVLDRVINTLSLTWIVWLWISPEPWKVSDYALIAVNIIIAILFIVNLFTWLQIGPVMDFNSSWQDLNWANISILIIIAGLVGMITKKPDGWGIGVGFLAINLTGYVAHLVLPTQSGDFSGIIRLVQVFTYPLIPVLTRRFPMIVETFLPAPKTSSPAMPYERTRFSAERRTVESWLQLSAQEKLEPFTRGLVRAVGQTMVADICMLLFPPDSQNQIVAQVGYDLIRQDLIPGVVIKGEALPEICNAFNQNQPLIMSVGGNLIKDLRTMRDVLGLKAPANILFVPILKDEKAIAGLLVCSPYSTRLWDITDESFLLSLSDGIAPILDTIARKGSALVTADLASMNIDTLREKYSQLAQEFQSQEKIITDLKNRFAASTGNNAGQPGAQFSGDGDMAAQISYLESELSAALDEISKLKGSGVGAVQNSEVQLGSTSFLEIPIVSALIEDIKGNLITFQKSISESTKGEVETFRSNEVQIALDLMNRKLGVLASLLELHTQHGEPAQETIDIRSMLDKILLEIKDLLKEKGIVLKTEIPEKIPPFTTNPKLLQAVFTQLINGAINCSPQKGILILGIMDHKITIKDTGTGISQADLERIANPTSEIMLEDIPGMGMDFSGIILIQTMLQKIGGKMSVENNSEGGKSVCINFI